MLSLDVPHLAIGLQRGTPPLRRPSMSALFPHTQVGCVLSTGAGEEGRAHADLVGGIALGYVGLLARGGSGDGEGEERCVMTVWSGETLARTGGRVGRG